MASPLREPVNALTHLLGAVLAAVGLVVLLVDGAASGSARQVIAFAVLTYSTSRIYHSLHLSERGSGTYSLWPEASAIIGPS